MKFFLLIVLFFIEANCLIGQSNDTLIIDSSIFVSIERASTETYLVAIQHLQKGDTARFFVSDDSAYIAYYMGLNKNDTIKDKLVLVSISKYEICEMFGFRASKFSIIDESFNVIIDSRLRYYKQINTKIVVKKDSLPKNSKEPK